LSLHRGLTPFPTRRSSDLDALAAVQHWLRLASVIPESRSRIAAEYDAATLLMAIPDYPQAVQVLQQFRQQYPQHPLTGVAGIAEDRKSTRLNSSHVKSSYA